MKKILQIIPYKSLYPPQNGGQLRCFHLMDQLARFNQVDVLSYQSKKEINELGYSNPHINFYTPQSFSHTSGILKRLPDKIANAIRYRYLRRSLKGPAGAVVLDFAHVIMSLSINNHYDFVIFEHISSMMLAPIIKRLMLTPQTIIDAHNIDYKLTRNNSLKEITKRTESTLYKEVNSFWACSQKDKKELEDMNHHQIEGFVIPNGVDSKKKPFHKNKNELSKNMLFCGSLNYAPNKEGLLWFYENVWPLVVQKIPDASLTIIGRGDTTPFEHFKEDKHINLIGEVKDVAPFYQSNYISIVPLLSGSGTRLKILEAMSFGNPVITTSIGIEGIDAIHKKEAFIVDKPEDFVNAIIQVINTPSLGESLRLNAFQLIQSKYDWNIIGNHLNNFLSKNA